MPTSITGLGHARMVFSRFWILVAVRDIFVIAEEFDGGRNLCNFLLWSHR